MGFIRRKEPVKRSKARSEARDPFVHLHEERAKLEEGEPWFLAGDDSADFQVQAGISSNLSADDLAAHEDAQHSRPSPDEAGPPTQFDGLSPDLANPGQVAEPLPPPEPALPADLTLPAEPRREPWGTEFDQLDQTASEDLGAWQADPPHPLDGEAPAPQGTPDAPPTPPTGMFADTGFMPPAPGFTPADTGPTASDPEFTPPASGFMPSDPQFTPPTPEITSADETPFAPVETGFMPLRPEHTPVDEIPLTATDSGATPSHTEMATVLPADGSAGPVPLPGDAAIPDVPPPDAPVTAVFEPPPSIFDRPAEPTSAEPAATDFLEPPHQPEPAPTSFLEPPHQPEPSAPVDTRNLAAEASVIFGQLEPEVPQAGPQEPDLAEPSPGPAVPAPAPVPEAAPGEAPLERTLAASFRNLVAQAPPPPPEVDEPAPAAAPSPEAGTVPAHPESPSDRVEPRRPRRPPRRPRGF